MRWIGHALRAEADIDVDPDLTVVKAHGLAVDAEHALIHTDHPPLDGDHHGDPRAALSHHAGG